MSCLNPASRNNGRANVALNCDDVARRGSPVTNRKKSAVNAVVILPTSRISQSAPAEPLALTLRSSTKWSLRAGVFSGSCGISPAAAPAEKMRRELMAGKRE